MLHPWLTLSLTPGIGPILARRLIEAAGSASNACAADANLLRMIDGIGTSRATAIATALKKADAEAHAELDRATTAGTRIICPDDDEYPLQLKTIPDPPLVLYVRGKLEPRDLHSVAIVGSRRCSFYGREQAERFGALLGGAGVTVISGGARGVDSAAHRGALSHPHGRTIAVLGSGVNVAYPSENAALFDQIAQRGAVLSEYPIDTPPLAENFPKRNRIVSGLSRGVLVVEADDRSGALITARQAGEDQGRIVFALPGRVDNKLSTGPHQLIRDGATLVTKLEDILNDLGPLPAEAIDESPAAAAQVAAATPEPPPPSLFEKPAAAPLNLSESQSLLFEQLTNDPASIDQLVDRTGLDASIILRDLTYLTLKGAVQREAGQTYRRTR
jgi:DNA processing protein